MPTLALIITDLQRGFFGHAAKLDEQLGDVNVLTHTVRRAGRIANIDRIVLLHPADQQPEALIDDTQSIGKPIAFYGFNTTEHENRFLPAARAARKWSLAGWRGGLGGMSCFDEVLPLGPIVAALRQFKADTAYLLRGEWCLHDPAYAAAVIELHTAAPEQMKLCFTQAPPGLAGAVTSMDVLAQMCENHATFGNILGYNPNKPYPDPIGRDVNHPIPASVRDCARRFIYDMPRSIDLIKRVADQLGDELNHADAVRVTNACRSVDALQADQPPRFLPQQITLELTPHRPVTGPITPQHYTRFDRDAMDAELAGRIVTQLGAAEHGGDVALMLGGLGDALMHPMLDQIIQTAHDAGVLGIGVETDLHADEAQIDQLLDLPVDVVTVRLNADTAAVYEMTMGMDAFKQVITNLQYLFNQRSPRAEAAAMMSRDSHRACAMLPWIVPRLIKTGQTLKDMESFFDRWKMISGHAVIESNTTGCGIMPDLSPVPMTPPQRTACRQLGRRMTILSNGQVALCDQDWLGSQPLGDANVDPLMAIWQRVHEPVRQHGAGQWDKLALCGQCPHWHRA